MRKYLTALLCTAGFAGLAPATEVTLVKYDKDKKEVTVKVEGGEKTYKVSECTKFTFTDQDGKETTGNFAAAEKTLKNEKAAGRAKLDIATEKDAITAMKFKGRKK